MNSKKRLEFFSKVNLGDIVCLSYWEYAPKPENLNIFLMKESVLEGTVYALSPRAVRVLEIKSEKDVFMDRCWLKTKRIPLKRIKSDYKITDKYFKDN